MYISIILVITATKVNKSKLSEVKCTSSYRYNVTGTLSFPLGI